MNDSNGADKMKAIAFVLMTITTACSQSITQRPADSGVSTVRASLRNAVASDSYAASLQFVNDLKTMEDTARVRLLSDTRFVRDIFGIYRSKLADEPSDSLFALHVGLRQAVANAAELTEMIDGAFSHFFVEHIDRSLEILQSIQDQREIYVLVESAVFQEGNNMKIINFIESKSLTDKPYYKAFLKYKY